MIGNLALEYVAAVIDARETRRYWQQTGQRPNAISEQIGLIGTACDWSAIETELVARLMRGGSDQSRMSPFALVAEGA
jgi:hypothetical protein